jgi:IS6 family transposase
MFECKGRWCCLYRAIDSTGATIDFLLSALRDADQYGLGTDLRLGPSDLKQEGTLRRRRRHRPVQYLSNILEQDHRAIKRRVNAKQGFREFQAAQRTIQGYEAMHMLRKGQVRRVRATDVRRQVQFIRKLLDVAA